MYVNKVLVCATFEYFCCSAGMSLRLFVYGVQNLEYRTDCLTPNVAFLTGDHKSGNTVHSASYILAMCGKFNGCCYVYDVQHLEYHTGCNYMKPSVTLHDVQHGVLRVHGSFDILW